MTAGTSGPLVEPVPTKGGAVAAPLAPDGTVAVIGAALSGLRAVQTFRNEGFVGRILLVGDEQHAPYDRPPL